MEELSATVIVEVETADGDGTSPDADIGTLIGGVCVFDLFKFAEEGVVMGEDTEISGHIGYAFRECKETGDIVEESNKKCYESMVRELVILE